MARHLAPLRPCAARKGAAALSARSRIHVLHVIKGLGLGGAERLLEHGQRHVDRDRFRLSYVYFLPDKDALAGRLRDLGGEVTLLRAAGPLSLALSSGPLARHARSLAANLIHGHLPVSGVVARLAGRRAGVPVIYTEHSQHARHRLLTRWANRGTWGLQQHVVAVSEAVERSIPRRIRRRAALTVIPNGVPVDDLGPDPAAARRFRSNLGIDPDAPLVGHVAVFRREKRLDLWLEAAAALTRKLPSCRFALVGYGPQRSALEKQAARLGLGERVHFTGLLEDVRPALSALDLLLSTSRFEGLPLTLLEAMATSVPVVATAVGGVPELITHDQNGVLVESADATSLAEAVALLLEQPDRRRRLARAARATVAERFSSRAMQRRLEELYLQVLGR